MRETYEIRAVLFEEEGRWVAQCLEHDIAAQAHSREDLLYELERVLVGYFVLGNERRRNLFEGLPPAPSRYWQMFEQGQPVEVSTPSFRQGAFQVLPDLALRTAA